MSPQPTSLRDHYREETRLRILDAAIDELAETELEELTMAGVAARAGVTERTVFRHFATRDELIKAMWPRMVLRVRSPGFPSTATDLIGRPLLHFPEFDGQERQVRASAFSAGGREVRRTARHERQAAFRSSVHDAFPGIEEPALTRLAAVCPLINSVYSWAVMKEDWGFDGAEAGRAASAALAVLLGRAAAGPQPKSRSNPRKQEKRK